MKVRTPIRLYYKDRKLIPKFQIFLAQSVSMFLGMVFFIALHFIWSAVAAGIITRQKRAPAIAAAWWLTIVSLPVVGTLLYLLAGWRTPIRATTPPPQQRASLQALITADCGFRCTQRNRLTLLHNGSNAFTALISTLQRATRSIHMEYYIFRDDRIGCAIAEILIRKARSGVEVRVIYDAIGSWPLGGGLIGRLRKAGVEVHAYAPLQFPWFTPWAARRNHRKIVVVDGCIAFLGGINIAKYYIDGNNLGRWRDEHLRLEGDVVADLQQLFAADWMSCHGKPFRTAHYISAHKIHNRLPIQIATVQEGVSRHTLSNAFTAAIIRARHSVQISSPYFLPPPALLDALRIAVRSGVKVQVMIPTCSDSAVADWVSDSYIWDLLEAGVEIFRYENGFLHAKLLVVDDTVASVGTANMDYRSLEDNLEVTAFIYDPEAIRELSATFERDLEVCIPLQANLWHPSGLRRTIGDLLRLIAPLL